MTETNNLNISPRNYSYTEKTVRFKSFTDQSWGWGVGTYSEETIHWSREWNETWYLCSYQCWYFDVDRKWATVEVMIYIETLWENMFICFRPTEQTLTVFGRNFTTRCGAAVTWTRIFWWSLFEDFCSQQHPKGFQWIL